MTPNKASRNQIRWLVTLIFLVGLAMTVAASVQLALRADTPLIAQNTPAKTTTPSKAKTTGTTGQTTGTATTNKTTGTTAANQPATANQTTPTKPTSDFVADPNEQKKAALAPTEFGLVANLGQYATNIMRYALPLGIALAVIMTIYAGILFMISQGQPDRIKDSQEIIQGAILGLVILIMARFMVNFLILPGSEPVDTGPIVAPGEQL